MKTHRTEYRVIYGDTDNMGVAYHANYLRWFEIGRAELFRFLGITYKSIEEKGYFLPVSEAYCKYIDSARYDDLIIIETAVDSGLRAGMKFNYRILRKDDEVELVRGFTKHAYLDRSGRVIRPPRFITDILKQHEFL
ncbi:MAG: thioesterase family protein [Desulfobacterales bacterium]|nr:thioesterase family protein [Desulfobacterales bacterium]MDX2511358.1 thioesterase family protein [Desulfobacterales bacterium]